MIPPDGWRYFDAHTHLHPPRLFAAIRRWFDEHTDWNLRGPTEPAEVAAALRAAGVRIPELLIRAIDLCNGITGGMCSVPAPTAMGPPPVTLAGHALWLRPWGL